MAFRRRARRRARRLRRKMQRRKVNTKISSIAPQHGLPRSVYTALNYSHSYQLTSTTTTPGYVFIGINNLNDVEVAIGGHQPYMRDVYADLYSKYRVYAFKYEFVISSAVAQDAMVAVRFTTDTAAIGDVGLEIERGAKFSIVSQGSHMYKIKGYSPVYKVAGTAKRNISVDDGYAALVAAGPLKEYYLGLSTIATDLAQNATINVIGRYTFYCQFFDFKNQPES